MSYYVKLVIRYLDFCTVGLVTAQVPYAPIRIRILLCHTPARQDRALEFWNVWWVCGGPQFNKFKPMGKVVGCCLALKP
jgi:hypothetical protein